MSPLQSIRDLLNFFSIAALMTVQEILYKCFYRNRRMSKDEEENIEGDVVIVTGASRGMGAKVAEEFAKRGATVILGCIDIEEGAETVTHIKNETGNKNLEMIYLDLGDLASVQSFAMEIKQKYSKIRILVNNGGIFTHNGSTLSRDGFNIVMAVNYFGHFLLTNLLLENLKRGKPSRVVSMSSIQMLAHKLDLNDLNMEKSGFGFLDANPYNNSKYAIALFIKELGNQMLGTGVTTYALCPGPVKTTIFNQCTTFVQIILKFIYLCYGFTAEEAASEFILYHAISKKVADETGIMYRFKRHLTKANKNLKDSTAKQLWDISANLVQLEQRLKASEEESGIEDTTSKL